MGNSVVALKVSTGEFVWGFQVVHHDLWDYDVASQPILFTWRDETPAIAISTKMGRVFVLNRSPALRCFPSKSGLYRKVIFRGKRPGRRNRLPRYRWCRKK